MALAPNCERIVAALAREYPQEFKDCHRPELGARAWAFVRRVAWVLHTTVDQRFGLNGKRGNVNDPSMDAVSFRNPNSAAGGVEIYDVVGGAGGGNPSPAWIDVTQQTIDKGTVGAYIQPEPVASAPKPPPDPGVPTTPEPPVTQCKFQPCTCNVTQEDLDSLMVMVADLARAQQATHDRQEDLAKTLVQHLDDVKARVERVSQELANKPNSRCKIPW